MSQRSFVSRLGVIVGILVALGAVALGVRLVFFGKKPPPQFDLAKADKRHIVAKVTATGTLSALVTVQVGAQVSGRISALHADFNSAVKKNQLIAQIDPELFDAALLQARANYLQAQGQLGKSKATAVNAKSQYERAKQTNKEGLLAQQDLETAQATWLTAEADIIAQKGNLEQARAGVIQAEVNLKYTKIISPVDGVVISRSVDVGQTVASALQAPTLFTIAEDLRKMQVDTSVAEGDVGKLQADMKATFTVDAFPSDQFHGTVRQIRNAAVNVQNVITYDAVLDVDNEDLRLRPGMTANVTFVCAEKDDTLSVPNAALRFHPPPELTKALSGRKHGGAIPPAYAGNSDAGDDEKHDDNKPADRVNRSVWVYEGEQLRRIKVKAGVTDGTVTEILEGDLDPGEDVIVDVLSIGGKPVTGAAGAPSSGPRMPRGF